MDARKRLTAVAACACAAVGAAAQIPDQFDSFEMGGRGMGMGGGLYSNASDASASYWNPAGLGQISTALVEINFRNRPTTMTTLTGNAMNPMEDSAGRFGRNQFSFVGVATPFRGGVLGLSYAVGGYAREVRHGNMLLVDPVNNITEDLDTIDEFVNEFITLAFGTKRGESMSLGAGVVFARQNLAEATRIQLFQNGNPIPSPPPTDDREDATGVGGIVGVQIQPRNNPNVSFGASYRSQINVSGYNIFQSFSDSIPARLQAGFIFRKDGLRGGQDYLIGGVDAAYFFATNGGLVLERKGHVSGGLGFEYNLSQAYGYIPIRLGVRSNQSGGAPICLDPPGQLTQMANQRNIG